MYILGFDIGGTKSAVVIAKIFDKDIDFIYRHEVATTGDWKRIIDELIKAAIAEKTRLNIEYSAVGISCGGPLSIDRKRILSPPNLKGWDDVNIVDYIERSLDTKAYMENDADACALAEYIYGAGRGSKNMIFLTFGTGLGAGIILDGRLYRGSCGMAGEVGHIRMTETGPIGYGKEGSLEGYASGGGIKSLGILKGFLKERDKEQSASAKDIIEAARQKNEQAIEIINTSAKYLGRGISILVDILNPDTIVIGSIFVRAKDLYLSIVKEELEKECLEPALRTMSLKASQLEERIGDYGAICAALDKIGH